jgi:hypothetical protein
MDFDPTPYLRLAARLEHHGAQVRARAAQLGHALAHTDWQSRSAAQFRPAAEKAIRHLGPATRRTDELAEALRRHANQVAAGALSEHRHG